MTDAQRFKEVIKRAGDRKDEIAFSQRLENSRATGSSQRTSTNRPTHETPKQK